MSPQESPGRTVVLFGSGGQPFLPVTIIEEIARGKRAAPSILLFGDSVTERVAHEDKDRRPLGEIFSSLVAPQSCTICSWSAFNVDVYEALLRLLKTGHGHPKSVVIPINLRSFSTQWWRNPAWKFLSTLENIDRLIKFPGTPVEVLPEVYSGGEAYKVFEKLTVDSLTPEYGTVERFLDAIHQRRGPVDELQRRRAIFSYHYTEPLNRDHPRLLALLRCLDHIAILGALPLLYVTPINHEAGINVVGAEFRERIRDNVEIISQACAARADVIDYSCLLCSSGFFHTNEPTEHLNAEGRLTLAHKLHGELR